MIKHLWSSGTSWTDDHPDSQNSLLCFASELELEISTTGNTSKEMMSLSQIIQNDYVISWSRKQQTLDITVTDCSFPSSNLQVLLEKITKGRLFLHFDVVGRQKLNQLPFWSL